MRVQFYQLTSIGDRAVNEDCMGRIITDDYVICVVADGLGGHEAGDLASRYFCHGLLSLASFYYQQIQYAPQATMMAWVNNAIDEMGRLFANDAIARASHTTCAILYIDKDRVITAHCGDSRVYRLNSEQIIWRTQDHSLLQQKLERGEIKEQDMGLHPEQNKLTRSVNIAKVHAIEVKSYPAAKAGETFVLCSDGFWELIKSHEWLELAQRDSGRDDLVKLARLAVLRAEGQSDNVTVQWVRCL